MPRMRETLGRRWPFKRSTTIVLSCIALIIWTMFAGQWSDKGCDLFPQSYGLVISHVGGPDHYQGCEDELGDPTYTDNYRGWP